MTSDTKTTIAAGGGRADANVPGCRPGMADAEGGVAPATVHQSTARRALAAVSSHDLALAIMEGCVGMRPPPGMEAEEAMRVIAQTEPDAVAGFYRAAKKVAELMKRELTNGAH